MDLQVVIAPALQVLRDLPIAARVDHHQVGGDGLPSPAGHGHVEQVEAIQVRQEKMFGEIAIRKHTHFDEIMNEQSAVRDDWR